MMGLLGQGFDDPRSAAVMALAGGLLQGNFGAGLLGANQAFADMKRAQAQEEMAKLQQRRGLLEVESLERDNRTRGLLDTAARESYVSPDLARQLSIGPNPDGTNMRGPAPGFDSQGFLGRAYGIDPLRAMEMESRFKPPAPIKLGQGEALLDPKTFKPLASVPKDEPAAPSAVREYQFAQGQGYKGTFEQWDTTRKKAGATNLSVNTGQKGLDNELKIRGDFRSEPIYKAHQEVQSAYSQIQESLKLASPAGDLAGATKIMKLLDPGSVVRESELGMAMKASGAFDRLANYGDMVLKGTKLTPTQRKDFQNLADKLYTESVNQYNGKRKEYSGFATDYGLNADRIVGPAITSPKFPQTSPKPGGAPLLDDLLNKYAPTK